MVWIIVMFLSIVWTLILTAPIHCRASKWYNATFLQIWWRNKVHLTHTVAKSRGFVSPVCLNEHLVVKPPHKRIRVFVSLQEVLDNTSNCISQISQNGQSASPWQVAVLPSDWLSQADSSLLWLAEFFTLIGWVELTVLHSDWLSWADSSSLWLAESGWQFFTLIGWVRLTVLHSDWLSSSLWLAESGWQFFTLIGWVELTVEAQTAFTGHHLDRASDNSIEQTDSQSVSSYLMTSGEVRADDLDDQHRENRHLSTK